MDWEGQLWSFENFIDLMLILHVIMGYKLHFDV